MPRKAVEAAAIAPEPPAAAPKSYTRAALDAAAKALVAKRKAAHDAARWCIENGKGAKAAVKSGFFGDVKVVTYNVIEPLRKQLKINGKFDVDDRDHHNQILTNMEREKLAAWILGCADGQKPKDRVEISCKVREMLKARHASNKQRRWRAGCIRLNPAEEAAVKSQEPRLAHAFFQRFYPWCRAHGIEIEEGVARSQDEKRAAKMTEAVVERHFHGEFGLEAELIDAGIMDPVTKVIKDPRRLLNMDETPQPIDAPQKGRRNKVAKRKGKAVRNATVTSKENASVNMTWDLSGHLYGLQLLLKLKDYHDGLVATPPPGAPCFDDACDLAHKQSRCCTFSRSADGMQTQQTLSEYLEQLDREITAHSNAAVAAGGEAIERPVVLTVDNHASRFSEEILKSASGQMARLGIRLFTEEAGTSGFLQSLDQYNGTFHRRYNDGRTAYKQAYEARYKTPCLSFGMVEFVKVLGGDADLGLPGVWFSWATPFCIVTAWRKVGIAGNVLAPELIDRSEFIDQPPAAAAAPAAASPGSSGSPARATRKRAADLVKTPEGMVSGSLESEKAKVARLLEHAQELEKELEAPFDPTAAGILVPDIVTRPDKPGGRTGRKRLHDLHGSCTMRGLGEEAQRRRLEDEAALAVAAEKKRLATEKKEAERLAAEQRIAAFELCEAACACGVVPCPWAGWKRCPTCGPKSSLCKVRACVAARKPQLLGYNPAVDA